MRSTREIRKIMVGLAAGAAVLAGAAGIAESGVSSSADPSGMDSQWGQIAALASSDADSADDTPWG